MDIADPEGSWINLLSQKRRMKKWKHTFKNKQFSYFPKEMEYKNESIRKGIVLILPICLHYFSRLLMSVQQ